MNTLKKTIQAILLTIALIIIMGEPVPGSFFDNAFVIIVSKVCAMAYIARLGTINIQK